MKVVKKKLHAFLNLALCLAMVFTSLTFPARAESDPIIVIAGSDYQNTDGGLFSSGKDTTAYSIMSQIKEDYTSAYGFLFGGDYYAHSTNTTTESTAGKKQLKEEIVDVLYPDMADDTQIYIQGNHDADSLTTDGTLATSGAHDTDYYGVYVINEKDYMWYNGDQSTIKNTASALDEYLEGKVDSGYSKPIFVLSHLPLHYSNRTVSEGDGKYAKYIYDVLDEAGNNGLNIIFLYGHNHSTSYYEEYLGNGAVYLAEGDTIYIANEGSQSSCYSDTLSFTYMNYGFTGYLTGTAADGALTMTVFEITDNQVAVKRYDTSGIHNLKSAGTNGSTPSGATYNTTVYTSPQAITLTTPERQSTITSNNVTVTAANITSVSATKTENPTYNSGFYSGYEEYTVSAEGYVAGKSATITIALTDGDFDTTRTITVKFPDGHTEEVEVSNGTITFETTALGTFVLSQKKQTVIEGTDSEDGDSIEYVLDTDGMDPGEEYIIVGSNNNIALTLSGATIGNKNVTISNDTITLTENYDIYEFYFTSNSAESGTYLLTQDGSKTVYHANGYLYYGSDNKGYWKVVSNGDGTYQISDYDKVNWYLNYGYVWEREHVNRFSVSSNTRSVRLYKKVESVKGHTITLDQDSGSVRQNAGVNALTGSKLILTYADGTTETINVTVGMLKDKDGNAVSTATAGTYTNLQVVYTYNDKEYVICDNYTLIVRENVQNNYPTYPNEGAVKVNKTATGIDFQSSGIAKVELSVSGVPSKKGVDVIVMVDTSSSMKRGENTGNNEAEAGSQRIDFLQTAVANLIKEFQAVGDDGEPLDIKVAIAEFNGYTHIDSNQTIDGTGVQTAENVAEIFTGSGEIDADAFVDASSITNPDTFASNIGAHSGTNYDYAFDTIYRLGTAITTENNANNEERDLYVIFMSDGAPYQYNYYGSGTVEEWNDYLLGTIDTDLLGGSYTCFYNTYGDHWMAEAIKGNTDTQYLVIDRERELGTDASETVLQQYVDAGIITNTSDGNYYRLVQGLGAEVHTIGFCLYDDDVGADKVDVVYETTQQTVMQNLASVDSFGNALYHETKSGSDLNDIFCEIASQIAYAANNAYFLDQMGDAYDLQLSTAYYAPEGSNEKTESITPIIEVKEYAIYTRQDYLDGLRKETEIGNRKGTYTVIETITFSEDGTKAYSTLIDVDKDGFYGVTINADGTYTIDEGDNILGTDGVIYAYNFAYNTTASDVTINNVTIAPESFYWKVGTVKTSELALSYYVYLTGSMEGTRNTGSYDTNNYATLYYENYLGNDCKIDTVSPAMPWDSALVKYAFYLVDSNGNPVNANGDIVTFANKVAVTRPVIYQEILLNNLGQVNSIEVASLGNLPDGYDLYDESAVYTVTINSNSTGQWAIEKGSTKVATTYVMQYNPDDSSAYSNEITENDNSYDYTHTVVWFAVVWTPQCIPDAVVIDYGLPVDIHVLGNDMFGDYGSLVGITTGKITGNPIGDTTNQIQTTSATSTFGSATVITTDSNDNSLDKDDCVVRYTPTTMSMNSYDTFTYSVNYTGAANKGYYYGKVNVIPATTIYYEDNFTDISLTVHDYDTGEDITNRTTSPWTTVQSDNYDASKLVTQDEDRVGSYSLPSLDANSVYGYDSAYTTSSQYSLGTAQKLTVSEEQTGKITFTYTGTGFDLISLTSNTTGTIIAQVTNVDTKKIEMFFVDTYYGYVYADVPVTDDEGNQVTDNDGNVVTEKQWIVDNTATDNAIYQIPVLKVENSEGYGNYQVVINIGYNDIFNHTANENSYDFYLDAVRIYNPADKGKFTTSDNFTDTTIADAYVADHENLPDYYELRNWIIEKDTFNSLGENDSVSGIVFIDNTADNTLSSTDYVPSIEDFENYGPNNEVYLTNGQAIAFELNAPSKEGYKVDTIQIAYKSVGETGSLKIYNAAINDVSNVNARTVSTATDLYYDITDLNGKTVVIANTTAIETDDNGNLTNPTIISITNIKITYKESTTDSSGLSEDSSSDTTEEVSTASVFSLRSSSVALALASLTPEPEVFEPETFEVEVTRETIKVGQTTQLIVKTSDDVESISINGETYTEYKPDRRTGLRTWKINITGEEEGTLNIEVIAIDSEGITSEPLTTTVTVNARKTNTPIGNIIEDIFDIFNGFFNKRR